MTKSGWKLAIAVVPLVLSSCGDYGTGERVGTVIKFAKQGVFCPTWEGEMVRGGMSNGSGSFSAPFDFTVEDPRLVAKVQNALDHQIEIKTTYHEEITTFCRSDSGNHFLTSIEPLRVDATQGNERIKQESDRIQRQIDELSEQKRRLGQ